jgi:hypothetical protein
LLLGFGQIFNPFPKAFNNVPLSLDNASEPHNQIAHLPNLGRQLGNLLGMAPDHVG